MHSIPMRARLLVKAHNSNPSATSESRISAVKYESLAIQFVQMFFIIY